MLKYRRNLYLCIYANFNLEYKINKSLIKCLKENFCTSFVKANSKMIAKLR